MLTQRFIKSFLICALAQVTASNVFAVSLAIASLESTNNLNGSRDTQSIDSFPQQKEACDRAEQPCYSNRLILESSPYLLQHAHNPINWYPWGKLALDKAKRENKPIFLSIGYAACHWCQVMEKQSFNNQAIGNLLNESFISIKVDREQRPDIDVLYGNAVMLFQGQKGWPMSVFLTPDVKPFFAGTYYNRKDFEQLLNKLAKQWNDDESNVIKESNKILKSLMPNQKQSIKALKLDSKLNNQAVKSLLSIVDNYNGGFGEASKFPHEPWLYLLLDNSYGEQAKSDSHLALKNALMKMARGGIYDQLSGGFHRYTMDPYWKEPHFEKMLYNQAMLISIYQRAYNLQPEPVFRQLVQQTIAFVKTEMSHPQGGFYAALDADSEEIEGRYYVWKPHELKNILNKKQQKFAEEIFDIDEYGETADEGNVLYIFTTLDEYSKQYNVPMAVVQKNFIDVRNKMIDYRSKRQPPRIDKKIIMSWNALMISSLAESSKYFNNQNYLDIAVKAADFIWNNMKNNEDGSFYRSQINGINSQQAQLDDYAFYLQALLTLYDMDRNPLWLNRAEVIGNIIYELFWDKENDGLYNMRVDKDAPLPIRVKSAFDMTLPSANSIAAQMFIRLARRTGKDEYLDKANALLSVFTSAVEQTPSAYSAWLIAVNEMFLGEKDMPIYAARGHIQIDAFMRDVGDNKYDLTVNLDIDKNWHINGNQPLNKLLIPTKLTLHNPSHWKVIKSWYPKAELVNLNIDSKPLRLYQKSNAIKLRLLKQQDGINPEVELQLQACNDRLCLPPEKFKLYPRLLTEINGYTNND